MISNGRSQRAPNEKGPPTANGRSQRASRCGQCHWHWNRKRESGDPEIVLADHTIRWIIWTIVVIRFRLVDDNESVANFDLSSLESFSQPSR
jgi:hypothetical protein